jgi:outer membrane protein TolC
MPTPRLLLSDRTQSLASRSRRDCMARLIALSGGGLLGCASPNKPIDTNAIAVELNQRLRDQIESEDKIDGQVSLYDAMARALKYNLDQKIELAEIVMRERQLEARSADMLPTLVAGMNGAARNNDAGSRSKSLLTGRESLEPSTSSERTSISGDLALSWDMLDYGLARVRQRQQVDERMISVERRRKVMNRILEDVRTAYWRAVSTDRTSKKLAELQVMTARAMRQAEEIEQRRIASPGVVLGYQRELIQVTGEVQRLQRELSMAKSQLAALMNLIPDTTYRLVLPDRNDVVPELPGSADAMVLTGLRFRSEIRESAYRQRIVKGELDVAFLRAMPSVRGVLGLNADSNDFLYNKQWVNFSSRLTWNLLEAFRYPKTKRAIEAESSALEQRDLALTMAIMTQIYVARSRFLYLADELGTARRAQTVQQRLLAQAQSAFKARAISQQQLVREELNFVLSEIRYDVAYSDVQNAYANLYASMGLDNFDIGASQDIPINQLASALEEYWTERSLTLPSKPEPTT